jgi:hypothetical protein
MDVSDQVEATVRLVAARVPELGRAELASIEAALEGDGVPASALEDVAILLDTLEMRGRPVFICHPSMDIRERFSLN